MLIELFRNQVLCGQLASLTAPGKGPPNRTLQAACHPLLLAPVGIGMGML